MDSIMLKTLCYIPNRLCGCLLVAKTTTDNAVSFLQLENNKFQKS